jgi:basic membrane protein A
MIKKIELLVFSMFAITLLIISGCISKSEEGLREVAMIFDSPIADDAFSIACLRGAEKAKSELGIGLVVTESTTFSESENLQRKYSASKQYGLIICNGGNQIQSLTKIYADFPEQKFVLVDGDITDKANVSSILSRDNESSFLAGALAAMVTQTNCIGFIGGMDIPAIHRFLAGYQAGAGYINPACKILVAYSGSWANDGKTKALALQQLDQGADIVFGPSGAGSLGVIQAVQERGLYAIGVDTDQSPAAPRNVLASAVKDIDVSIFEAIKDSLEGNFQSGIQVAGLKEGGVDLVFNNSLPVVTPEMKKKIAETKEKIISSKIIVPES